MTAPERCRLRDLGVAVGGLPAGPLNAITDVPGVRVGHCTVSWGGPELPHGSGPARTGVTAIFPHGGDLWHERVVAGAHAANGVGELIGISAVREWGLIETPILLTNSQSAGAVYDATVRWLMEREPLAGVEDAVMPVVGECDDGFLNDLRGMHVARSTSAPRSTAPPPAPWPKAASGPAPACRASTSRPASAPRRASSPPTGAPWTVGVLALTNFGVRHRLSVDGVPVGREITDLMPLENREGSCIVVLATDAPLSARQCERMAKRCALGLAATGSYASDGSGEIMLAFTTAHRVPRASAEPLRSHVGRQRPHVRSSSRRRSTPRPRACATRSRPRPPQWDATATPPTSCRWTAWSASCGAPGARRGCPGRSPALPRLAAASILTP